MNKTMIITTLAASAICLLGSCSDDEEIGYAPATTITIATKALNLPADGGEAATKVACGHEFSAYTTSEWLTVTPGNSIGTEAEVTIKAEANDGDEARKGVVIIWAGGSRDSITVTQEAKSHTPAEQITCPIKGYKLVWHDEFDGNELSDDWTAAIGKGDNGWGNNEIQYYTRESATVADGKLTITLADDNGTIKSSRLYGKVETGWKYCYIEARMKLPSGKGTWPAFWMMPVNFTGWPADGEIDIMEEVGYAPNTIHSTIHCNKYNNTGTSIEGNKVTVATSQTEFHTYAMEWTADYMTFYADDAEILTYMNDGSGRDAWPFDAAFYPILNLAWGGAWGGAQGIDPSCLPAKLEVDYVRVFQK